MIRNSRLNFPIKEKKTWRIEDNILKEQIEDLIHNGGFISCAFLQNFSCLDPPGYTTYFLTSC